MSLTKADRKELTEQKQIEHAVSLFLDLDQDRTNKQIADELGISLSALKRLTQDPLFQTIYDETLINLGHHPRLQALQSQLPELIPLSYVAIRRMLGPGVAHTAQVQAIKLLWDTLKVADHVNQEDPNQLNNFLQQNGVVVNGDLVINTNLPIPAEYRDAFERLMGKDAVDAVASDVQSPELPSETSDTSEG